MTLEQMVEAYPHLGCERYKVLALAYHNGGPDVERLFDIIHADNGCEETLALLIDQCIEALTTWKAGRVVTLHQMPEAK